MPPEKNTIGIPRFLYRVAAEGNLTGQDAGTETNTFGIEKFGLPKALAKRWLKAAISKCSTPTEPVRWPEKAPTFLKFQQLICYFAQSLIPGNPLKFPVHFFMGYFTRLGE